MKGEKYKCWIMSTDSKTGEGYYRWFNTFKVYFAYEKYLTEQLYKRDMEASFTGQFLKSGFETFGIAFNYNPPSTGIYKKSISPTNNWFGTSKMEPDTIFIKDDIEMVMSLQGIATPYNEKYKELFENCSCKYIRIKKNNDVLYEDWTGNLPPKELVDSFITK